MARQSREYTAFRVLTDKLLSVPREEIQKRIDAHRKRAAKNPNKRGPKPTRKITDSSASGREEE